MSLGLVVSASVSHPRLQGFETRLVAAERDQQHMENILFMALRHIWLGHTVLQFDPLQKNLSIKTFIVTYTE